MNASSLTFYGLVLNLTNMTLTHQTLLTALISLKAEQMRMARLERYDENDNPPALKRIEKAIKEIEEELK